MSELVIESRIKHKGFQLRSWVNRELFNEFKAKCETNGVKVSDAFEQFMEWYIKQANAGVEK